MTEEQLLSEMRRLAVIAQNIFNIVGGFGQWCMIGTRPPIRFNLAMARPRPKGILAVF